MIPQNPGGVLPATTTAGTGSNTGGMPTPSMGAFGGIGTRRATLSLSDLRTPLVENIMAMLPTGHDKAFKAALYNVIALILAAICIIAFWAAYCILEPFIVPLLWALLCGSVIHPFKEWLVTFTREWLNMVKASPTPLSVQLVAIPFQTMDSVSEGIGGRVTTWWKHIVFGAAGFFLTYLLYHNPPATLGTILYWIVVIIFRTLFWMVSWINGEFVLVVTIMYVSAIAHYVYGVGAIQALEVRPVQHQQSKGTDTDADNENKKNKIESESIDEADSLKRPEVVSTLLNEGVIQGFSSLDRDTTRLIYRIFSVTTWTLWFIYFCRCLPYPLLLIVGVSLIIGSVVFIRKYSLRRPRQLTPYSALVTLLTGAARSAQNSRGVSRKGSILQVQSRLNEQARTPSPGAAAGTPSQQHTIQTEHNVLTPGVTDLPLISMKRVKPNLDLKISHHEVVKEAETETTDPSSVSSLQYCLSDDNLPPHGEDDHPCSEDEVDGLLDSNLFLYAVFCACLVVQVWNRLWLVHLLPIPVIYYGLKRLGLSFGFHDYCVKTIYEPLRQFYLNTSPNSLGRDFFSQPVRIFFSVVYEADRKIISVFESYLDMVATIIILVAVMVVSVIFMIFVATQFYAEGDHLVRVGVNVINSTVSQYPEISELLPEGWESLTGSLVGNAYHYGRDYIKTMIRDSVAERNPEKAEEMEKQVIELWDRIYISWNRTWGSLETVNDGKSGKGLEWNDIVKTGQNVTDWFDTSMLMNYAKANYGQLRAVLESVWTVLIGNVSLAISVITSIFSVLFGGGSALLNLIISFVVFFTALFYLLSASTSVYKPVELFNSWLPGDGKLSGTFVSAIEESVSGVFSATLKMSAFYGMWTWLIHTLFQVNIVFVPSFFAAIFAAVPLLMPYWAVFPAVLELWLIQGQWTKALFMLLSQMAPMSLVDAQIYSEIKGGGHPYLTALAVAGGIFYFGFQGAIMGPVVLCFVFVAIKVGSTYIKEGTLDSLNV